MQSEVNVDGVERGRTSDEVREALRQRILDGNMDQGERIIVREIAAEFGTSPLPVREALRMLQSDGLVTIRPNRGAEVVRLTPADIPGTYLVRGALEGLGTRLAGPQLTVRELDHLESLNSHLGAAAAIDDLAAYYRLNREFHSAIFGACPFPQVGDQLQRVWGDQARFGLVYAMDKHRMAESLAEHATIVTLLRNQQWVEAESAARDHKYAVARSLLRALNQPIPDALRILQ